MNKLTLKCHIVSVAKTFEDIEIGESLGDTLIVGTSRQGEKLQFCNPLFEEISAANMGELMGTSYKDRCPPEFYKKSDAQFDLAFECGISIITRPLLGHDGRVHMIRLP